MSKQAQRAPNVGTRESSARLNSKKELQRIESEAQPNPSNGHSKGNQPPSLPTNSLQKQGSASESSKGSLASSHGHNAPREGDATTAGRNMVEAQQISFFQGTAGDGGSPVSIKEGTLACFQDGMEPLKPFNAEDAKSFEDGDCLLDDDREVGDFVSDIEMNDLKLRGNEHSGSLSHTNDDGKSAKDGVGTKGKHTDEEDEECQKSSQCSIDDVTDDEDGQAEAVSADEEQRSADGSIGYFDAPQPGPHDQQPCVREQQAKANSQQPQGGLTQKGETDSLKHQAAPDAGKALRDSSLQQQAASTNESTTHRDSSSSNKYSAQAPTADPQQPSGCPQQIQPQTRLEAIKPAPIQTKPDKNSGGKEQEEVAKQLPLNPLQDMPPLSTANTFGLPKFDNENIVKGHFQRFKAHVETRELNKPGSPWRAKRGSTALGEGDNKDEDDGSQSHSSRSKSEESAANKDNEDPNAAPGLKEKFEPKELRQEYDGWHLYKKQRISFAPVRRYQLMVDQDYKKNKVTVCAHLQNIFNSFNVKRGKAPPTLNNYFDIDKFINKLQGNPTQGNSPVKDSGAVRRQTTLNINATDESHVIKENFLLTKSNSTAHIPETSRAKNTKRAYANFDKDLAVKMFGYRVVFRKKKMQVQVPEPHVDQSHKPIVKFTSDILAELTAPYAQVPRYLTKQRILVPLPDSDEESMNQDEEEQSASPTGRNSPSVAGPLDDGESSVCKSPRSPAKTGDRTSRLRGYRTKGELVVLKNRHGEKQTFIKRNRNLLWHMAPIERQQSANTQAKRAQFAKGGNQGTQSFLQNSPTRTNNSISPKKFPGGWPSHQSQTPQTRMQSLKQMIQVRYAPARAGNVNYGLPGSQIRSSSFGAGGIGNQNFANFRRQNSYRKGHRLRGESAKGGRGLRQSMENATNPAYKLINQGGKDMSYSDQNFILNGHQNSVNLNDSEVARITGNERSNVVHLKDPKHIQGFGSNIVHVNVSCGQAPPVGTAPPANAPNNGGGGSQLNHDSRNGNLQEDEDDEDAQTFVIQLSEEQTRQLSEGTLRLNGVLIPKDLSNLSYEQIMALLDSVNLPPKTSAGKQKAQSQQPSLNPHSGGMRSNNAGDQKQSLNNTSRRQGSHGAQLVSSDPSQHQQQQQHSQTISHQNKLSSSLNGQFKSSSLNANGHGVFPQNSLQPPSIQGGSLLTHSAKIDSSSFVNGSPQTNFLKGGATTTADKAALAKQQQQHRTLVKGRQTAAQNAPQKASRLDSASRHARALRQQSNQFYQDDIKRSSANQRQHNNSQLQKGSNMYQNPGAAYTRNNVAGMGNSEWDMLTVLTQQQKQLKNAQQFLQQSVNYEHARKMQALGYPTDGQVNDMYQRRPSISQGTKTTGPKKTGDSFKRATLSQIKAQEAEQQAMGSGVANGRSSGSAQIGKPPDTALSGSSHQMAMTQANFANQNVGGGLGQQALPSSSYNDSNGFGNGRTVTQEAESGALPQQKSLTRLASKKRMNRKTAHLQKSSSRGYLKNGSQAQPPSARHQSNLSGSANSSLKSKVDPRGQNLISNLNMSAAATQANRMLSQINHSLIAHENQLLNNHANQLKQQVVQSTTLSHSYTQSQQNAATMRGPHGLPGSVQKLNNYYKSIGSSNAVGSTLQQATTTAQSTSTVGHGAHAAQNVAQLSTKSHSTKNQASKTSIELEYQKFDNSSGKSQKAQANLTAKTHSNIHSSKKALLQNERGPGVSTQYYQRMQDQDVQMLAAQKFRQNQNNLSNLNYSNQSSTSQKRKIESALAQSAMNAIQSQSTNHSNLPIGAASTTVSNVTGQSSFLQFEQKAFSNPPADKLAYHQSGAQTSYLVKSNDFRKHSQTTSVHMTPASSQPPQQQPAFIMRQTGLTSQNILNDGSDYKPMGATLPFGKSQAAAGQSMMGLQAISSKMRDLSAGNSSSGQKPGATSAISSTTNYNFMSKNGPSSFADTASKAKGPKAPLVTGSVNAPPQMIKSVAPPSSGHHGASSLLSNSRSIHQ